MPSITVDKFYWWFAEDDKLWQEWTYLYSENIDVLSSTSFAQLSNWNTNINEFSSYWKDPNIIIEAGWEIIMWCEDWYIFKEGVSAPVYIETIWEDIVWMFINSDDLIFITYHWTGNPLRYNSIALSDISNNSWTWLVTEDKMAIPTHPTSRNIPVKQIWNKSYIWVWANVIVINYNRNTSTYEHSVYIFPNKDISWITYSWALIKVFQEDWIMYVWNWKDENYQEAISLDVPIRNVLTIANIDYVIWWYSSYYTEFFKLNWYTLVPIFKRTYSEKLSSTKFNIQSKWGLQNQMSFQKGSLYLPTNQDSIDWVSVYWNWINGLPKWLSVISTKSSFWYAYSCIYWVYARWTRLYIAFTDYDWNIWLDSISTFEYNNQLNREWILYSLVYNCWNSIIEKQFRELEVRTEWTFSNQKITVCYSINGSSYYSLWEITTSWITHFSMDWMDSQSFRDISFKFVFDATANPTALTTNIKLYWFTMHYDFNKQ